MVAEKAIKDNQFKKAECVKSELMNKYAGITSKVPKIFTGQKSLNFNNNYAPPFKRAGFTFFHHHIPALAIHIFPK